MIESRSMNSGNLDSAKVNPAEDRTVFREPAMAFRHPASGLEVQLMELVGRVEELATEVRGLRADGRAARSSVEEPVDGFDFRLEALEQRLRERLEHLESEKFDGRTRLSKLRDALNAHLDEVGARDGSAGIWKWITGSAEAKLKERIHNTLREAVEEMDQVLDTPAPESE